MNNFEFTLPSYAHIPGKTPHPISDPDGHSYNLADQTENDFAKTMQRGLFLFQNEYYWEAHEAWEQAWIQLGRRGEQADFVKGLIKLAAGGVKCLEENQLGAERHLKRAKELLSNKPESVSKVFESWLPDPEKLIQEIDSKLVSLKKKLNS